MNDDYLYNVVIDVGGRPALAAARTDVEKLEKALKEVQAAATVAIAPQGGSASAWGALIGPAAEAQSKAAAAARERAAAEAAVARELAGETTRLEAMAAAEREATRARGALTLATAKLTQETARGRAGFTNMGMGILYASQAVEDLQYGFSAIVNNIPLIVMGLGGSGGVAGAVSLAAVGINVLKNNYGKLLDLAGVGIPQPALQGLAALEKHAKDGAEELARLREQAHLSYVELLRLGELEAQQREDKAKIAREKAAQDLRDSTPEGLKRRAEGFKKAVAETGGDQAFGETREALDRGADAKGLVVDPISGEKVTSEEATKRLFAAAGGGDAFARRQISQVTEGAFGARSRLGPNIKKFSPEFEDAEKARKAIAEQSEKAFAEMNKLKGQIGRGAEAQADEEAKGGIDFLKGMNRDAGAIDKDAAAHQAEADRDRERARGEAQSRRNARARDLEGPLDAELGRAFAGRQAAQGGALHPEDLAQLADQVAGRLSKHGMAPGKARDIAPQVVAEGFKRYQEQLEKSQLSSNDNMLGFLQLAARLQVDQQKQAQFQALIARRLAELQAQQGRNAMQSQTFLNRGQN
jgi:hypothetical protein